MKRWLVLAAACAPIVFACCVGSLAWPSAASACGPSDPDHCYADAEMDRQIQGAYVALHTSCLAVPDPSVDMATNEMWVGSYNSGGTQGGAVWAEAGIMTGPYFKVSGYSASPTFFTATYNAFTGYNEADFGWPQSLAQTYTVDITYQGNNSYLARVGSPAGYYATAYGGLPYPAGYADAGSEMGSPWASLAATDDTLYRLESGSWYSGWPGSDKNIEASYPMGFMWNSVEHSFDIEGDITQANGGCVQ